MKNKTSFPLGMMFLPQVGFLVEKGSYGLEIVPRTSCVK
jgi:hypothetical protein